MLADLTLMLAEQAGPATAGGASAWADFLWTFGVQVANFLLLVLVLWFVLYKRVIKAMDQREKKIAAHFEAAEEKEQAAQAAAAAAERDKQELDAKREALLKTAVDDADARRKELTEQARRQVEEHAQRWRQDLAREKEAFLSEMRTRAGDQVCAAARRALEDLADSSLESRMVDVLIRRLQDLPQEECREFAEAVQGSGGPVIVATAMPLDEQHQQKAAGAVHDLLAADVAVEFQTAPELACGVELRAAGREISWTIASYVQGIHDALASGIDAKLKHTPQPAGAGDTDEPAPDEATDKNE